MQARRLTVRKPKALQDMATNGLEGRAYEEVDFVIVKGMAGTTTVIIEPEKRAGHDVKHED